MKKSFVTLALAMALPLCALAAPPPSRTRLE